MAVRNINTSETVIALLPRQYAPKWKNDEGQKLFVVMYVESEDNELRKLFIPALDFKNFGIKNLMGQGVKLTLDEDEEGRTILKAIEKLDKDE